MIAKYQISSHWNNAWVYLLCLQCIDFGAHFIAEHIFTANQPGQLSIEKGQELKISSRNEEAGWYKVVNSKGETGLVPMSSISVISNLEIYPWYHGNITRAKAELTLSSEVDGSFLVRNSTTKPGKYALSLRYDGSTCHYVINIDHLTRQCYFDIPELSFQGLPELVEHHSKNADGLATTLSYPAFNPRKPPKNIYSHEVDEWEVDRSDIKTGQTIRHHYNEIYKAFIKERNIPVSIKITRVSYMS